MIFQVLTATSMKMTVFWDVAQCSLVQIDRRFRGGIIEAVSTSETSVNFYQTTRRNIAEDSHLQCLTHCFYNESAIVTNL
jgi:hypothetical protein